jgi:DNA-binding protein HU-beta
MNRKDLVDALATQTGKSKKDANDFLDAFVDTVKNELKGGGSINLVGFGTFKVNDRPAREARNPRTGAKIKIPARQVPVFKVGKGLKDMF